MEVVDGEDGVEDLLFQEAVVFQLYRVLAEFVFGDDRLDRFDFAAKELDALVLFVANNSAAFFASLGSVDRRTHLEVSLDGLSAL